MLAPTRIFIALLYTLLSAVLIAESALAGETLDRIERTGRVVLGIRESSVPFSYTLSEGEPVGYTMDICMKLVSAIKHNLKRDDLKVSYVMATPATRFSALIEGKTDLDCGPNTNTAERRTRVAFTITNFIATSKMLVRDGSGIRNWTDLHNKVIASTSATTNAKTIMERSSLRGLNIKLVETKDDEQSFRLVENGSADAFAMDDVLLYGLRATSAKPSAYRIVGDPLSVEPYAVMFSKRDAELKKVVDVEMARIILSGEIHALYAKWFNAPIPPRGINLKMPMNPLLRTSFQFPSDSVGDEF